MVSPISRFASSSSFYYGWIVLIIAILFELLSAGIYVTFTFFVRPLLEEFGGSQATILLAVSLAHIGFIFMSVAVGLVVDRLDIRRVILVGLLAIVFGLSGLTLAQNVVQVIAIYAITITLAMGCAGLITAQTLAAKWFQSRRGLALGLVSVGGKLSLFVFAPIVVALLERFGWRGTFYVLSAIGLALILPVLIFVRSAPEDLGLSTDSTAGPAHIEPAPSTLGVGDILRHRNFWIAGLSYMIPAMSVGVMIAILDPMAHEIGIDKSSTAVVAQIISAIGLFSLVFGRLADRFDHRKLLISAIVLVAGGLFLFIGADNVMRLTIAGALVALGNSGLMPIIGSMIVRTFGRYNFGRVMGLTYMFILLAALGPPIAGAIRERFGSYDPFFLAAAVATLLLGSIVFWLKPDEKAETAPVAFA